MTLQRWCRYLNLTVNVDKNLDFYCDKRLLFGSSRFGCVALILPQNLITCKLVMAKNKTILSNRQTSYPNAQTLIYVWTLYPNSIYKNDPNGPKKLIKRSWLLNNIENHNGSFYAVKEYGLSLGSLEWSICTPITYPNLWFFVGWLYFALWIHGVNRPNDLDHWKIGLTCIECLAWENHRSICFVILYFSHFMWGPSISRMWFGIFLIFF